MANIPQLRDAFTHDTTWSAWIQPLAVVYWPYSTTPPKVPYCYDKLIPKVIRALKMFCCTRLIYHIFQPISIQVSNHPVYNML
jgi:hypothetical protein